MTIAKIAFFTHYNTAPHQIGFGPIMPGSENKWSALFRFALVMFRNGWDFLVTDPDRVVAVAFLTEQDLSGVGRSLKRVYHLEEQHDFDQLLAQIDHADRSFRSGPEIANAVPPTIGRDTHG